MNVKIRSKDIPQEKKDAWDERLKTVFNRGFWGGYYAHKRIVEHTNAYGSSATHRKEYVGKITNYFKNIGVAEITVEASTLAEGDDILIMGETTGVVEQKAEGIVLDNKVVAGVKQGDVCSIKTVEVVRRGDKLYKEVLR
jgi:putative protease